LRKRASFADAWLVVPSISDSVVLMLPGAPGESPDSATRLADEALRFREFGRARLALRALLVCLVPLGVLLHDLTAHSVGAKLLWMLGIAGLIAYPLGYLLAFRCPRCRAHFLATGDIRDFLGFGRVLWAKRCGTCRQESHTERAGEVGRSASEV
jgi:hypothetical protein